MLVTACAGASNAVFCGGRFKQLRDDHAASLLMPDVPDHAVLTGERLILAGDAACGQTSFWPF